MNTPESNLVKTAWTLSKANPELWERFLSALDDYTNDRLKRSVGAPTAELHIAVGMSRQALEFYTYMQSLDELAKRIEGK